MLYASRPDRSTSRRRASPAKRCSLRLPLACTAFISALGERQIIQQVFKAFGIDATTDDSMQPTQVRLDIDDASFDEATRALALVTNSFYVPLDAHHVLVARDTQDKSPGVHSPGDGDRLSVRHEGRRDDQVSNLAKQVFGVQQAQVTGPPAGTITIRAPRATLEAFNSTIRELIDGQSQVLLDVR